MGFTDFFCKEIMTSLISFSSKYTFLPNLLLKAGVVQAKNYEFLHFFFGANRIGSETSQKLPNESPIQKLFQLACDLFILMDSAIICIYFRNTQLAISFKMNAASLIRNMLAIILRNLLKQYLTFSSNTFQGPFNADLAAAKAFFSILNIYMHV